MAGLMLGCESGDVDPPGRIGRHAGLVELKHVGARRRSGSMSRWARSGYDRDSTGSATRVGVRLRTWNHCRPTRWIPIGTLRTDGGGRPERVCFQGNRPSIPHAHRRGTDEKDERQHEEKTRGPESGPYARRAPPPVPTSSGHERLLTPWEATLSRKAGPSTRKARAGERPPGA